MIQRKHSDLMERMIQEAALVLARLLGLDEAVAEEELNIMYHEWLNLDRQELESLDEAAFREKCLQRTDLDAQHLQLLGELLHQEGQFYFEKKTFIKSKIKLQQALWAFQEADRLTQTFSFSQQQKTKEITALISEIELHYQQD